VDEGTPCLAADETASPELHRRALDAVLALTAIVASARSEEELAERAVEAVQRYTGAAGVAIYLHDEPRRCFTLLAQRGPDDSEPPPDIPIERSLTGLAAARGHTVTVPDLGSDERIDPEIRAVMVKSGFGDGACVPILDQGRPVASLNLAYRPGTRLSPEDRRILEAMAGSLGIALAHRQAGQQQVELEEQARRAQQLESLGILAGGVAHDFNNLLVGIIGNVDLAREEAAAAGLDETAEGLEDALRAADRARSLVRQLLTFSRGGAPVKQTVASLAAVVKDAALFALRGTSVRCELAVEGDLGVVQLDPGQVAQVVQNLVLNAAQASAPGASVSVKLDRRTLTAPEPPLAAGAWVRLRVSDQGRGIPPDDLARIFEPFFSRRPGGTGLGLAVCHSIVRRHAGHIAVESTPGRGTTFIVHLPAGRPEPRVEARDPAAALSHGGRALVMDDEASVRAVARRMLERQGFDVVECKEGMEALGEARAAASRGQAFDLALLDVTVVGGAGGLEIARALRTVSPSTRVVVSTGYAAEGAVDPMSTGADAQLEKPYTSDQLTAVLARLFACDAGR
jgi:signal transduction histidine kinase/CheY-like chemotaxis protein